MAPRSRTGCLTCRQRKLKCSEERPTCAQCVKANRECVPSSGITFRHQQNPSMNGKEQESLKSFYGYKETFGKSTTWVDIPEQLTFVHTNNPYEDDDVHDQQRRLSAQLHTPNLFDDTQTPQFAIATISQSAYPAYATHGLEALSAVASQDQYSYAPPATMGHQRTSSLHSQSMNAMSPSQNTASQNLDFILNPASNLSPAESTNIDPRLHSQTPAGPSHTSPSHDFHLELQSTIPS